MTTAGSPQSLRAALAGLDRRGELLRVEAQVDPRYEIAACLAHEPRGAALVFENVRGYDMPVVGSVLTSRERIARALGVGPAALQERIVEAIERPLGLRDVERAPCQERSINEPDLGDLPVPTFFEHETGPYLTAAAIVARDPEGGALTLAIARLKPLGGSRALVGIAPNHHLAVFARTAGERGETLPIACAIGNHPAVLLAACLYLDRGVEELGCAAALLGEPLEVARSGLAALPVPAHCEVVLEGTLDPAAVVDEGPVSEFHGMYEDYGRGMVATFARLTQRGDAMLQIIQPGRHPEHMLVGGVAIAAGLARRLRRLVPEVRAVAVPEGGSGRLAAVLALDAAARPGSARRAILASLAEVTLLRTVTVVDADVDPWDAESVEWARSCFARPDRDLLVVPGAPADRADPLGRDGTVAKLGIDATRKAADRDDHRLARPPHAAFAVVERVLGAAP